MHYLVVSIFLYIVGRFSPYEWQNQYVCQQDKNTLTNQFSAQNSFWYTFGQLLKQGIFD